MNSSNSLAHQSNVQNDLKQTKIMNISMDLTNFTFSIPLSKSINIIISSQVSNQKLLPTKISGKLQYTNGFPVQICSHYKNILESVINKKAKNMKVKLMKQENSFFEGKFSLQEKLLYLEEEQSQVGQLLHQQNQILCSAFSQALMKLGVIKSFNRYGRVLKQKQLQLKKRFVEVVQKKSLDLNLFQTSQMQQRSLVRPVFQIIQNNKQNIRKEKPRKGGYFIVQKQLCQIKEIINGQVNSFEKELACKFQKRDNPANYEKMEKELEIVGKVKNSKHFLTYWKLQNQKKIYMDYVPETLRKFLSHRNLEVAQMINILQQIVEGVNQLHEIGVVHRDLKSQNFLVSKNQGQIQLKIIDFGQSTFIDKQTQEYTHPLGFTLPFSPFQCIKNHEQGKKRKQIDYWSIGVLIFEVINQKCPFTFGPYIGSDIIQNWLFGGEDTSFNTYYNKKKKYGLAIIEQLIFITGISCLKISQNSRFNLVQLMNILFLLKNFTENMKNPFFQENLQSRNNQS